jgi:hypothetical protein
LQVFGVIVGVIGCIVDGIANTLITALVTCYSQYGSTSGDANYAYLIYYGCSYSSHDCTCIESNGDTCFYYSGGIVADDHCENVLGEYTSAVHGAIALDLLATFAVFVLSIGTCVSVCCPGAYGLPGYTPSPGGPVYVAANGAAPAVQMQTVPVYPQQVVVQQQGYYPQQQGYPPQQVYVQGQGAPQQVYVQPQGAPQQVYVQPQGVAQAVVIDNQKY